MPKERRPRRPCRFAANAAWLAVQVMAHNLARWTARIGLGGAGSDHQDPPTTLLLHCRTAHPFGAPPHFASSPALAWENQFSRALARLLALPFPA